MKTSIWASCIVLAISYSQANQVTGSAKPSDVQRVTGIRVRGTAR